MIASPIAVPPQTDQAKLDWKAIGHALSHDLQAPLRGISSLGKILREKHGQELSEEAAVLVQALSSEAVNSSRMLEALLRWTRCAIEPKPPAWVDAAEIARETFAKISSPLSGRKIEFSVAPLPPVWSEPQALSGVFHELLANAVKFSVFKSVSIIGVTAEDHFEEIVITVRDNGVGFQMDHAGQLFGLFRRLHRKQEFDGLGAGLAIAQRIVQLHQGRIWAEADLEHGAAFHFSLPKPFSALNGSPSTL